MLGGLPFFKGCCKFRQALIADGYFFLEAADGLLGSDLVLAGTLGQGGDAQVQFIEFLLQGFVFCLLGRVGGEGVRFFDLCGSELEGCGAELLAELGLGGRGLLLSEGRGGAV